MPEIPEERREADPAVSDEPVFATRVPGSTSRFDYLRIIAGVAAGLGIVGIVLFSVTDLAAVLLPMEDRYLEVLVPPTEDGSEPFVLNELTHETEENRLSVEGRMTNRSVEPVENAIAVITARETTGRFPVTLEIPVEPAVIEPGESGMFSMSVTLRQKPDNYSIRFKLENGPFVPHADERVPFNVVPAPDEPIRLNMP